MSATPPLTIGMAVPLRDVERELAAQTLAATRADEAAPAQRVRMSNLVVYTDNRARAEAVAAMMPDVVETHPARVLLLLADPDATGDEVRASVQVTCQRLTGKQQACSELVLLHAPAGLAERLPFAVRALVIGDLPTNLLWASAVAPPLAGPILHEHSHRMQQILYDSFGWPDPIRAVAGMSRWIEQTERTEPGRWRVVSDLNWRRLKFWRRLTAQALEPPGIADAVREVRVEHGPNAVVQAWMQASWLVNRLGWKVRASAVKHGVEMAWQFAGPRGEGRVILARNADAAKELVTVHLSCVIAGRSLGLTLRHDTPNRLALSIDGEDAAPRTQIVPTQTPAELIGRQLSDRERDPVFRESMALASGMAQAVLT